MLIFYSYETRGWRRIEFDALNAFIKTLPQFRIRERLEQAWGVITDHYRNRRESGPASKERSMAPLQIHNDHGN